jgi:DNA uptake protein ComE-like DNA-binding protein
MEIEMWQKCYGRCMDMLVDVKVSGDVARRTAKVEEPVKVVEAAPKQPEPPKNPEPEKDNRLDVNSCTATALKKIGFSLGMARKIVAARPFKNLEDLKRINGLKATQYRVMEPKLCCKPAIESALVEKDLGHEPESVVEEPVVNEEPVVEVAPVVEAAPVVKVNVNTASAKEIAAGLGVCVATGYSIVGWRKKNRPYEKLEDLLSVTNIGPGSLQKWGHLVEI